MDVPPHEVLSLNRAAVEWREIDGEVVAIDLRDALYLGVNASGTLLWRQLRLGTTREELVDALAQGYGLDQPRAEADVDAFLDDLRVRGLLG